jgi:hypothetical protein
MRIPPLLVAVGVIAVAACDPLYVGSTASVITTDKLLTDHAISLYSGKDCSTVRVERGQSYCKEDEVNPEPTVYCFRTLGGVDCYSQPTDPSISNRERLGRNDHNTTGR